MVQMPHNLFRLSYFPNLIPVVDVALLTIGVIYRLNPQASTANFAFVCETYELWVVLTSSTIALVLVGDDGGASANDTRCIDTRD
jgi:hypothetical protein